MPANCRWDLIWHLKVNFESLDVDLTTQHFRVNTVLARTLFMGIMGTMHPKMADGA